jgi:hypothetical protein
VIAGGSDFTITPIGDPAQIGPDGRPQKGWFAVRRNNISTDATVTLSYSGTAANGSDYTLSAGPTLDFAPNQAAQIIALTPLIHTPTTFDPTATAQLTGFSGVTASLKILTPVDRQLTAYRTGDNFGTAVSDAVKQGGDPLDYIILVDDDYEQDPDQVQTDIEYNTSLIEQDQPIDLTDHDLAKITLHQLTNVPSEGTIQVMLSDSSAVRLYKDDGTPLNDTSLDLTNPSGDLAGLTSGDVNVWVEGLHTDTNFALGLNYVAADGKVTNADMVHMTIADFTFQDLNGNVVRSMNSEPEQILIDALNGMPGSMPGDDLKFVFNIDGLPSSAVSEVDIESDYPDDTMTLTGADLDSSATRTRPKMPSMYCTPNQTIGRLSHVQFAQAEEKTGVAVLQGDGNQVIVLSAYDGQRKTNKTLPWLIDPTGAGPDGQTSFPNTGLVITAL